MFRVGNHSIVIGVTAVGHPNRQPTRLDILPVLQVDRCRWDLQAGSMGSRFWQRYKNSPLATELLDRAAYFTKAVAAIYIVRENLVEFTVVRETVPT